MKLVKYFVGSLIISFGVLMVLAIMARGIGVDIPDELASYAILVWLALAVLILPWAKNIVRVE